MKKFLYTSVIALLLCSSQSCGNGNIELEEARIEQANKLEETARVAKEVEELAEKERLEAERSQTHTVPSEYVKKIGDSLAADMDMFIRTHQDKNSYAKVNVYQLGTKEIK